MLANKRLRLLSLAAITEPNAYHGDLVKQDQVLAKLHATQQEAKVARAKAAVLSAEVAVKNRMPIPSRRAPSWRSAWRSTNASRSRPEALAPDPEQAYANLSLGLRQPCCRQAAERQ